jgi:hypothetical protein
MDDVSRQQKSQRRHMERGRLNVSKRKRWDQGREQEG